MTNVKYKFMMVDDHYQVLDGIKETAWAMKIDLQTYETWEEAQIELERNFEEYDAIILDGRGKIKIEDPEDDSHLTTAIQWLNTNKGEGKHIPFAIFTAYVESFKAFKIYKTFDKTKNNEKEVFEYLKHLADQNPINKTISKNALAFKAFGNDFLSSKVKKKLAILIQKAEEKKWVKSDFNAIREIIEKIYLKLNKLDPNLIPPTCLKDKRTKVNLEWCYRRLRGDNIEQPKGKVIVSQIDPVLPEHISWQLGSLQKITSICSHNYTDERLVNEYSFKAGVFTLLDILVWFNAFVEDNYAKKK